MKKRIISILMVVVILVGVLAACGNKGPITEAQAKKIALEHAGLKEKDVSDIHTHVVDQNGIPCYSMHITTADGELSVIINVTTGEVME